MQEQHLDRGEPPTEQSNQSPRNKAIKASWRTHCCHQSSQNTTKLLQTNHCHQLKIRDRRTTRHLQNWENKGWIEIKNTKLFKRAAYLLKKRTVPTYFKWVKGHEGDLGNEESNKLAKEGTAKHRADKLYLNIPNEFNLQGARLDKLT